MGVAGGDEGRVARGGGGGGVLRARGGGGVELAGSMSGARDRTAAEASPDSLPTSRSIRRSSCVPYAPAIACQTRTAGGARPSLRHPSEKAHCSLYFSGQGPAEERR